MIPTLLSGIPPSFGAIVSATENKKKVSLKTDDPPFEMVYADALVSVSSSGGELLSIESWGEIDAAPIVKKARLSKKGLPGSVEVVWDKVERVAPFAPGFFQFRPE